MSIKSTQLTSRNPMLNAKIIEAKVMKLIPAMHELTCELVRRHRSISIGQSIE